MRQDRILKQVDTMVASGRITEDEAARLREAQGTDEFEGAVAEIRLRHANAHMETAVAEGEMTTQEAADYALRIGRGEHPKGLRARLARHRRA